MKVCQFLIFMILTPLKTATDIKLLTLHWKSMKNSFLKETMQSLIQILSLKPNKGKYNQQIPLGYYANKFIFSCYDDSKLKSYHPS